MAVIDTHNLLTLCCGYSSFAFQPAVQPSSIDFTAIPTPPSKPRPSSLIWPRMYCGAGGAGRTTAAGGLACFGAFVWVAADAITDAATTSNIPRPNRSTCDV